MSTSEPINRAVAGVDTPARRTATPATSTTARAVKVRKKRRRITVYDILAIIFIAAMLAFSLIPLAWMLSTSLKRLAEVFVFSQLLPTDPQWGNYVSAWTKAPFGRYFFNSAFTATAILVCQFATIIPAASMYRPTTSPTAPRRTSSSTSALVR